MDSTAFWGHVAAHRTAAPWWRGPWGQAEVWGSWASSSQPHSQALTSTASLTTLWPRILSPSPTPVPLLPETPLPPHPFPHLPFLGLVFPFCLSPQSSPFLPSPCSIACVLLPASSPPLPFRAPGINFLSPGLASSHLYPVRTHWKDRLSPRPCFPQEPTMHYRQGSFEI